MVWQAASLGVSELLGEFHKVKSANCISQNIALSLSDSLTVVIVIIAPSSQTQICNITHVLSDIERQFYILHMEALFLISEGIYSKHTCPT